MSTPEDLYRELAELLSKRKDDEVLEIEILSPGLDPLLQDGRFVGITKKALVQAYIAARRIFFEKLARMDDHDFLAAIRGYHRNDDGDIVPDDDSIVTEIILLFDCEHLTACNWRKRWLNALIKRSAVRSESTKNFSSYPDDDHRLLLKLLERERSLMTTYLCSPLHRHTKSPTLWQHRLWVMTQLMKFKFRQPCRDSTVDEKRIEEASMSAEDVQSLILAELAVVLRAGEQHPKNYYAFSYMRQLHSAASRFFAGVVAEATVRKDEDSVESSLSSQLAECMVDQTLTWCLAHLQDVSGWTFLFYLLETIVPADEKDQDQDLRLQRQRSVVDKVIHFAVNITAWEGESLWTFVDLMVRRFGPEILPSPFSCIWDDEMSVSSSSLIDNKSGGGKGAGRLVNDTILLPDPRWKKLMEKARGLRAAGVHVDSIASGQTGASFDHR
ncbi:hypothetical protein VTN96DRAFT_7202 [Rasamsonia emersonii]|uniref:Uncharacterized protein n=1 Tax=Rasamsonia emersonii (strain ATCC 16479 / CBS 393.64 / IMI 116815) TaxID=1408163 RepID=A0A0F4Z6Z2_RASE3|nr:hypothetical protein T310_0352 [Rasamsonia emersonii CBS 393.64]KKA25623.1 hypothetical protein T310_0352 [Rasamsonia emersonii CBS 393.64]